MRNCPDFFSHLRNWMWNDSLFILILHPITKAPLTERLISRLTQITLPPPATDGRANLLVNNNNIGGGDGDGDGLRTHRRCASIPKRPHPLSGSMSAICFYLPANPAAPGHVDRPRPLPRPTTHTTTTTTTMTAMHPFRPLDWVTDTDHAIIRTSEENHLQIAYYYVFIHPHIILLREVNSSS